MKNEFWFKVIAMLLAVVLTGCASSAPAPGDEGGKESIPATEATVQGSEGQTDPTVEEPTEDPTEATEAVDAAQRNSVAMLNYLAMLSQQINSSNDNLVFLEEVYAQLLNNTNPEHVDGLTETHLLDMLDTIEDHRMVAVKRDRIAYLFDQNRAMGIKASLPSPVLVLGTVLSEDLGSLALSVTNMAADSLGSYILYNNEMELSYLQEVWELDDETSEVLHQNRKSTFQYLNQIVREHGIPEDLALSEKTIQEFVDQMNNENVDQRMQFLKSQEETYGGFGLYWLELAKCCYQRGDHASCLEAIATYRIVQGDIFRKDSYLAEVMPLAVDSASKVYPAENYPAVAEGYLQILLENTQNEDWALRYFAAYAYVELYGRTQDKKYLDDAYEVLLNNINQLAPEQAKLDKEYLGAVMEIEVPDGATKEQKKQIKDYNKALKERRETAAPPVYEPLLLNCDLFFALTDARPLTQDERSAVEGILYGSGRPLFLASTIGARYGLTELPAQFEASYEKDELTIPASLVSERSVIRVTVTEGGQDTVYEDWSVDSVDRPEDAFESFTVTFSSEAAEDQRWSADSTVKVEIFDEKDTKHEPVVVEFKVSEYQKILFVETVKFERAF